MSSCEALHMRNGAVSHIRRLRNNGFELSISLGRISPESRLLAPGVLENDREVQLRGKAALRLQRWSKMVRTERQYIIDCLNFN